MSGDNLSSEHRKMLKSSGISDEVIQARGYRTVRQKDELIALGFKDYQARVPGLLIPIHAPGGNVASYQFRPDNPRKRDGKSVKYESLSGQSSRLDVPLIARPLLADPKVPLWITEGIKKADSAASRGLCCVALTGVWNFKGTNEHGGSAVIGDFDHVPLEGRTVNVAFDSDAPKNRSVEQAEKRVCGFLRSRGAKPGVIRIPSPDGQKVGLDDYFAADGTVDGLLKCLTTREPPKEERDGPSRLLELVLDAGVELWHGSDDEPFASYRRGEAILHSPLRSRAFETYCSRLYFEATRKALGEVSQRSAMNVLAAKAVHDGPCYAVERRIGWHSDCTYLALHDERGAVVEARADGWRVLAGDESPIRFVKPRNARPLPVPERGGRLEDLRPFVNVEEADWPLVKAFELGCFLPAGTCPVFVGTGEQGSGKSFGCRLLRELLDPAASPLRSVPRDHKGWMAALASGYLLAFDNLSGLTKEQSNTLCQIASGSGLGDRTLYTNTEETVVEARRSLLLNGIGEVVTQPDLADRTLLVRFRRFASGRKGENELLMEFERARPGILGAVLDGVCRALGRWQNTDPGGARLHDFAKWVIAAVADEEQEGLREALEGNRAELQGSAVEHDPFAQSLIELLEEEGEQTASASELLNKMDARRDNGAKRPFDWPKTPRAAASHLMRIAPSLRMLGYTVEQLPRKNRSRPWLIAPPENVGAVPSPLSPSSLSGKDEPAERLSERDGIVALPDGPSPIPSPAEGGVASSPVGLGDGSDGGDGSIPAPAVSRVLVVSGDEEEVLRL